MVHLYVLLQFSHCVVSSMIIQACFGFLCFSFQLYNSVNIGRNALGICFAYLMRTSVWQSGWHDIDVRRNPFIMPYFLYGSTNRKRVCFNVECIGNLWELLVLGKERYDIVLKIHFLARFATLGAEIKIMILQG